MIPFLLLQIDVISTVKYTLDLTLALHKATTILL